jgi:hypothetical protein
MRETQAMDHKYPFQPMKLLPNCTPGHEPITETTNFAGESLSTRRLNVKKWGSKTQASLPEDRA